MHPIRLITKEEIDSFEVSETKKMCSTVPHIKANSKKCALSTIDLTRRKPDWHSDNESPSLAHSYYLSSFLSYFAHDDDVTYYSPSINIDLEQ